MGMVTCASQFLRPSLVRLESKRLRNDSNYWTGVVSNEIFGIFAVVNEHSRANSSDLFVGGELDCVLDRFH